MIPTIKTLEKHFKLNRTDARKVRKALELWGKRELDTTGINLYRNSLDRALNEAGNVLNSIDSGWTFGVEAIRGEWKNGYWCDIRALYINTGDTYNATLVYDRETNRIYATDYGSFIESLERKGERIE